MERRKCAECGQSLRGRADQKFCSPSCRSSYNNRRYRDDRKYINKINSILKQNRDILAEHNVNGKTKIPRNKLFENGFRFDYFTNRLRTRKGTMYYFCYDQGFLELDDERLLLVENKNEE